MSRLIIKNLPGKITKDKLLRLFSEYGTITDVRLAYTKDGKFRRFGFVGFKDEVEAMKARQYFNNSLILNQRVTVDECKSFQPPEGNINTKDQSSHSNEENDKTAEKSSKDEAATPSKIISDADFLNFKKTATEKSEGGNSSSTEQMSQVSGSDPSSNPFTIFLRAAPAKLTAKQVIEFFYPIVPTSTKISKGKSRGSAMIEFKSRKDVEAALKRHGDCISGKTIKLREVKDRSDTSTTISKPWQDKIKIDRDKLDIEEVAESGRLFVRNLAYICTEDDLENLFCGFGPLAETHIPIDSMTRKNMGIGFVSFMFPEHAVKAWNDVDGTVFQGRMIHILPAKGKPESDKSMIDGGSLSSYKKEKAQKEKSTSQQSYNWNTLFIGTNAVAGAIAEKYSITKGEFLHSDDKESTAVRVALGETQIVQETRQFLIDSGISLDAFSQPNAERSKSVMIAKNLPAGATAAELREMFEPHGDVGRLLLAPAGVTAVIEFLEPSHARQAFVKQAYRKFHHKPLYLEWAPVNIFNKSFTEYSEQKDAETAEPEKGVTINEDETPEEGTLLFVKNINFDTREEDLRNHFSKCGPLQMCTISKKKSHKKEELLSMGYGFVQYYRTADADKALRNLQGSMLDGHQLELKKSNQSRRVTVNQPRKKQKEKKQTSTKILVRNVPFQADCKELTSLFKTFGELKSIRLPKKLATSGKSGVHRGFAFVDYITKQDAKKAFEALCHSTHLYGRRLVLEWADSEEDTLEGLRRKTAERFHGTSKRFKGLEEFEKDLLKSTYDT